MNQTGIQMLMRAMGFDPALVAQKAAEFEQVVKQLGSDVQAKVTALDDRMGRMEAMIAEILSRQQQQGGPTQPAGECSAELHLPPVALIVAAAEVEDEHPEKEHRNGRYTGNSRTTRRNGKAH